jgi:hypothetical protein
LPVTIPPPAAINLMAGKFVPLTVRWTLVG